MKKERRYRILVVDDDELLRAALVRLLERFPFELESAASGEEALRRLKRKTFDAICTDLEMPGMNGIELIRHVRRSAAGTSIVLMTGRDQDERVQGAGADAFLRKPFSADDLRRALDAAFQRLRAPGDEGEAR